MMERLNQACKFFPCHKDLEDCTFCYCPFYPCRNDGLGSYIFTKDRRRIWSCQDCNWIHLKKVVDKIFRMIRASNLRPDYLNPQLKSKKTGIIILGHGSKLKQAKATILKVIKDIKEQGLDIVEPAYLQLCPPDLHASIKKVVTKGCKKVIIVPFFLFTGNHVSRDIPKAIKKEAQIFKGVKLIYAKNVGQDPRISAIVMDCINKCPEY